MARVRGSVVQTVLAVALALGAAAAAQAESTTERSSSIVIFPKVIFDGSRDTFIQISNTSNSMAHAHCFYVNAAPICSTGDGDCLATPSTCSGRCDPQWQEVDFSIWLTKQQPTHWSVSDGRFTNSIDAPCDYHTDTFDCDGAGFDPGRVPPVGFPFVGELRCIEVDQSGAPISGNRLKGEATIVSADGDAGQYNAVGLLGDPFTNDGNNTLCLGGGVSDECPSGAEYSGCGARVFLNAFSEGADNPIYGPTSEVTTEVTLVPCRSDYERQEATSIGVQMLATNEFEQVFSGSIKVDCWRSFYLREVSNIFEVGTTQTRLVEGQMRSSNGSNSGFVGVVEEYHRVGDETARATFNLHEQGTRATTDFIFLPEGP